MEVAVLPEKATTVLHIISESPRLKNFEIYEKKMKASPEFGAERKF